MVRGTDGPVKENCWLCSDSDSMVSGAVPVLLMCSVCLADCPMTTLLKLKLVVERASAGAEDAVREATAAQPESKKEKANRNRAAAERLRTWIDLECGEPTPMRPPQVTKLQSTVRRLLLTTCSRVQLWDRKDHVETCTNEQENRIKAGGRAVLSDYCGQLLLISGKLLQSPQA